MTLAFNRRLPRTDTASLKRAIFETLAYSDVFDYPLRIDELHRFLTIYATLEELTSCVTHIRGVESQDGYYFLKGRAEIVPLREKRERISSRAFERALWYGRILGLLPFVRMVGLTGSLALRNCDETGDYDYMLVVKTGRVWLARAFALLLNRVAHLFGETLCPNLIVSEQALQWGARNLYSAREICQMVLISGDVAGLNFRVANLWIQELLPNWSYRHSRLSPAPIFGIRNKRIQSVLESPFRGKLGDLIEAWEMNRKIARFTGQEGFGIETNFNADICQGNFEHHGLSTLEKYHERLRNLKMESGGSRARKGKPSKHLRGQAPGPQN